MKVLYGKILLANMSPKERDYCREKLKHIAETGREKSIYKECTNVKIIKFKEVWTEMEDQFRSRIELNVKAAQDMQKNKLKIIQELKHQEDVLFYENLIGFYFKRKEFCLKLIKEMNDIVKENSSKKSEL